jgi:dolichol-phosphate mannosyltransferase
VNRSHEIILAAAADRDGIFHQYAEQRCVARQDAKLAIHSPREHDLRLPGPHHAIGGNKLNLHRGHAEILPARRGARLAPSFIFVSVPTHTLGRMPPVVVVPTYNERDTITTTIEQLLARPCKPDILVVDDSSPDGTGALVNAAMALEPERVHLLERPGKQGLGRAYAEGFAKAVSNPAYDVVVQMDADGSHAPADVDRLVAAAADADLVIGSRYVSGGSSIGLSGPREWLSRGGNSYARMLVRAGVTDLTGGFKAWRADLLRTLLGEATGSDGYAFQIEMTVRAARAGARIREVPITFHERRAGSSKMDWRIAAEAAWMVPWMVRHYSPRRSGNTRGVERTLV